MSIAEEVNAYQIVQVVWCADMVINTESVELITEMKSIRHSRLPSPPERRNGRVA